MSDCVVGVWWSLRLINVFSPNAHSLLPMPLFGVFFLKDLHALFSCCCVNKYLTLKLIISINFVKILQSKRRPSYSFSFIESAKSSNKMNSFCLKQTMCTMWVSNISWGSSNVFFWLLLPLSIHLILGMTFNLFNGNNSLGAYT